MMSEIFHIFRKCPNRLNFLQGDSGDTFFVIQRSYIRSHNYYLQEEFFSIVARVKCKVWTHIRKKLAHKNNQETRTHTDFLLLSSAQTLSNVASEIVLFSNTDGTQYGYFAIVNIYVLQIHVILSCYILSSYTDAPSDQHHKDHVTVKLTVSIQTEP